MHDRVLFIYSFIYFFGVRDLYMIYKFWVHLIRLQSRLFIIYFHSSTFRNKKLLPKGTYFIFILRSLAYISFTARMHGWAIQHFFFKEKKKKNDIQFHLIRIKPNAKINQRLQQLPIEEKDLPSTIWHAHSAMIHFELYKSKN